MEGPLWGRPAPRAWVILLVSAAVAVAVYPFQPFTGSLTLVVVLGLVVGAVFVAALRPTRRA